MSSLNFHPFKHQYHTLYLRDEANNAILSLKRGTLEETLTFPKQFLPPELQPGDSFLLNLQPETILKTSETEALKNLLAELIH